MFDCVSRSLSVSLSVDFRIQVLGKVHAVKPFSGRAYIKTSILVRSLDSASGNTAGSEVSCLKIKKNKINLNKIPQSFGHSRLMFLLLRALPGDVLEKLARGVTVLQGVEPWKDS